MVTAEQLRLAKAAAADMYSPIARALGGAATAAANVKLAYDLGVFVAEHARGGGLTVESMEALGLPGNPAPLAPPAPARRKKLSRYNILLKEQMKKSRLKGKTNVQRKKKFALAAKKAAALWKKEKKNAKTSK